VGVEVKVENLTKSFGSQLIWGDVSLTLPAGEISVMLGPSGTGKSVFLKSLIGLLKPDEGHIWIEGVDIATCKEKDLYEIRKLFGVLFQDGAMFGSMNLFDNCAFPLREHTRKSESEIRQIVMDKMDIVGLADKAGSYPAQLSGGQKQRVAIARALAAEPKLMLCDEILSALDVSVQAQVINLMQDLQQEFGTGYVFISHNLSVVEHVADDVMVMYLGRCVEKGTKDQIFNNPRHPYTQALLSATPRLNPDDRRERIKLSGELPSPLNPPPGCAFNARCRRRFGPCTQLQPQLKDYGGQLVACFAVDQDENPQR